MTSFTSFLNLAASWKQESKTTSQSYRNLESKFLPSESIRRKVSYKKKLTNCLKKLFPLKQSETKAIKISVPSRVEKLEILLKFPLHYSCALIYSSAFEGNKATGMLSVMTV